MHVHTGYSKSGFSLLEIIIAIAIIALFTVLPILAYTSYLKKARDEKRKSDINKISQALESYKAEKGTYPVNLDELVKTGFLPEIPLDPLQDKSVPWSTEGETFGYKFASEDGMDYKLTAPLEANGATGESGTGGNGPTDPKGSYYEASPSHPGGIIIPVSEITQMAQYSPTPMPPSSTPYVTQVPLGTITVTPSPTYTPTNTPTRTPTPSYTPAPSSSPTPTGVPSSYFYRNISMFQYQNGYAVAKTSDNGVIMAGNAQNGSTLPYLIKFSATGAVQWSKYLNTGTSGFSVNAFNTVVQDTDGGYIASGTGTGTGGGIYGSIILMKVDSTGNVVYAKSYAATYGSSPHSIILGTNGPVIAGASGVPRTCGTSTCITSSAYLLQVDGNGNRVWDIILADTTTNGASYFQSVYENSDHSLVAAGAIQIASNYNVFVAKISSAGAPVWQKRTPPPGSFTTASGTGVVQASDGGYAVSGTAGYLTQAIFIQKFDANGAQQWTKAVDGSYSKGLTIAADGGYVAAGVRNDNSFVYKLSSAGALVWAREIGLNSTYDHEAPEAIATMNGGGFALVGSSYNDINGYGTYTYYNTLAKFDSNGNISSCGAQLASVTPTLTSYSVSEANQSLTSVFTVTATSIGSSSSNVTVYSGNTCN